jgi:predicted metal-dependent phosphoesterase TrpH
MYPESNTLQEQHTPSACGGVVDLHTHSRASDGSFSPGELIRRAAEGGLSAIALTDHDTIDGHGEAQEAADSVGIRFIPGIELEIQRENNRYGVPPPGEFHLLGLGIRRPSPDFLTAVASLARSREERNLEILERLRQTGVRADYEEVRAFSGGGSVGRPHFAALLISRGLVKNHEQAFSRYLGRGRPLFVPKPGLQFDRAAALIKESGGISVLAHPMSLFIAWGRLPAFIRELRDQGLEGLEAWHPTAKARSCKRLEELGKSLGLFITEGSDYHGESRPGRKLGFSAEGRKIPEAVLEAIPPLLEFAGL